MSLPDTPNVSRAFCPGCEPETDPLVALVIVRWCERHTPTMIGADDERATVSATLLNTAGEASGDDCRLFAELLHRKVIT